MKKPVRRAMGEEIVDKKSARLSSTIIGGHHNQLRTERATSEVTEVLDVWWRHAALQLVRTRRGDVSHLHRAFGDHAQDGVERPRHGMTPRTDCVIRAEIGRGSVTPSAMSTTTDTASAVTDQPCRSP